MQKQLKELKHILDHQITLHEGLRTDLHYEMELDGQMSAADFIRLQQRKYYWANQIEEAEALRISHVKELSQEWDVPTRELTLRNISARVPSPLKDEFLAGRETLIALVGEIRHLARKTGANAQARLKAVDATLAVVSEAVRQHPTYSGAGRLQQRPPTFKSTSA